MFETKASKVMDTFFALLRLPDPAGGAERLLGLYCAEGRYAMLCSPYAKDCLVF